MHAVSLLTVQMFEHYDRERFEVYAYSWSKEDGSDILKRIKQGVTAYVPVHHLSDEQVARAIRDQEIDILVDLQGLTSGARASILSYRPAPYAVTYLGFPGPVAHPQMDYVISDPYLITSEMEPYFVERPLHLDTVFQMSDDGRPMATGLKRSDYGLDESAIVFCAFSNTYKYTPDLFVVWMRILKAVPDAVLWLLEDNRWSKENLIAFARLHQVAPERLIFAPREAPDRYLARYALADLFLDTFPFNAGTTANDALFVNLPILTCSGNTFASRMAGALLHALTLDELIADDFNAYESKAIALGLDKQRLKSYPKRIQALKQSTGVFDSKRILKEIEARFWQLTHEMTLRNISW
jgi:predicted O-linked N-acetylglucosamine transferase (SPINDLY family)